MSTVAANRYSTPWSVTSGLMSTAMAAVAAVLDLLAEMQAQGRIRIVRVKDRFVATPSNGGWRDVLVNLIILDAVGRELLHVTELQIVHFKMLQARE